MAAFERDRSRPGVAAAVDRVAVQIDGITLDGDILPACVEISGELRDALVPEAIGEQLKRGKTRGGGRNPSDPVEVVLADIAFEIDSNDALAGARIDGDLIVRFQTADVDDERIGAAATLEQVDPAAGAEHDSAERERRRIERIDGYAAGQTGTVDAEK